MQSTKKILVGSHISGAGGLYKAFERGELIGCTAMQIFSKSNRSLFEKSLAPDIIEQFKAAHAASPIKDVIVHTGYLINIGSPKPDTATSSTNALLDEVNRCQQLGIKYLVLHPGSHTGSGTDACMKQIAHNLDSVIERSSHEPCRMVTILLETAAGQGTNVGSTFEELATIRNLCQSKQRIGFCLDTCHIWAAGYDISTPDHYDATIKKFDNILGLEHLHAVHLNDSYGPRGDRKDRHAPLGTGHIPLETFKCIMNDERLANIPKVLETPSDDDMLLWAKEIKLLRAMVI